MPKPVILFYTPASVPWGDRLKQYCALQGLRLRPVEASELDRAVGALAGEILPAPTPGPAGPVPEPMLVLCRLSNAQLDRLLAALRGMEAGECLKAVLTPANAPWSLSQLYRELCRERLAMGLGKNF